MLQMNQIVAIVHCQFHFVSIKTTLVKCNKNNCFLGGYTSMRHANSYANDAKNFKPNNGSKLNNVPFKKTNFYFLIFYFLKTIIIKIILRKFESITKHSQVLLATTDAVVVLLPNTLEK